MASYISVTEFQQYNPELDFTAYSTATLSGVISRASKWVDNFAQTPLDLRAVTNEKTEAVVNSNGNLIIHTRQYPIQSVSAISLKLGTASYTLSLADGNGTARYDIGSRGTYILYPFQEVAFTGTLSIRNFYQLRNVNIFSVISYIAGYETIPDDIKDACNLIAKDIFIRQSNPMDLSNLTQGGITVSYRPRDDGDSDSVRDAKQILQDYRRPYGV